MVLTIAAQSHCISVFFLFYYHVWTYRLRFSVRVSYHLHQLLLLKTLLLGDAGGEAKALNAASHADPDRLDRDVFVNVALDLINIHVAGVGGISANAMVLLDQRVKDLGEVLVGVLIPSIDAAVLIIELDGAGDCLGEGEPRCGRLVPRKLDE